MKVYVGAIGTVFLLDVGEDISGAVVSVAVLLPTAEEIIWAADVYKSKYIRHITTAESLPVPGRYRVQPRIASASGEWRSLGATAEYVIYNKFH